MDKKQSLYDIYQKYLSGTDGRVVTEASNIQNKLRGKVESGIMNIRAIQEPVNSPAVLINKQTNAEIGKKVPLNVFRADSSLTSMGMVSSTLQFSSSSDSRSYSGLVDAIMDPLSSNNTCLKEEKTLYSVMKIGILYESKLRLIDIPQNITVLQLRQYIISQHIFSELITISGWRLEYNGHFIDDSVDVYILNLPQGSILKIYHMESEDISDIVVHKYNNFNAATDPITTNPDGSYRVFVRTIERSQVHLGTSENVLAGPLIKANSIQESITKAEELVDDYYPILRREGYYMIPSHFDMKEMTKMDLSSVDNFTVGHEGVGEVIWEGDTDVCYLNLDDRVSIEADLHGMPCIQLYPPSLYLKPAPPIGNELNKRATVRLFNMFPIGVRTQAGIERYREMLKMKVEKMKGEWILYDSNHGILEFILPHF